MKAKTTRNSFILLLTATIWGIAFVAQSTGGDAIGPYSFTCIRNIIGSCVLIPVIMLLDKLGLTSNRPENRNDWKTLIIGGICCGTCLAIASILQQLGLYYGASAGKAGFLTTCYILIVPILGLFMKKKCGWNIWIGVLLTLGGLYLLCMGESFSLALSDILILLCAFCFSVHILVIDYFTVRVDGVRMSCIQFITAAVIAAFPMFFIEMGHSAEGIQIWSQAFESIGAWIPLLYAGICSSGIAYTLQIVGQKDMNPTVASLILSLESVVSVIAGWLLLDEVMGMREISGCVLIFIAIILAQLPVNQLFKKKIS